LGFLQLEGQTGSTGRTISLSNKEFGRSPAVLPADKGGDPLRQVFDVFIHAKKNGSRE